MNIRKLPVLVFVVSLAVPGAVAQVTLDECQRLAYDNYPQLKQNRLIEMTTEYNLSNASKGYLPQITVSVQATWQNKVPAFPDEMKELYSKIGLDMTGLKKDQYKVGADISQVIWDGGAIKNSRDAARSDGAARKANLEVDLYGIRDRVNSIYFGILILEEQIRLNDELQAMLKSNCDKIKACIDNGVAMPSDLDVATAELYSAMQSRTGLEASRDAYRRMLSLFVNKDLASEPLEKPVMPVISGDGYTGRPEMTLFDKRREQLAVQKKSVMTSLNPRIGAFAQGYYGKPGFDMFADMFGNKWSFNFMAGIKVQWNIGSFYTKSASLRKIETSKKDIDVMQETFLFNTGLQATGELGEIDKVKRQMEQDREIVRLREAIRKSSESKYANGVIDVNDLIRDITSENRARINSTLHEIDMLKGLYDLKNITGE